MIASLSGRVDHIDEDSAVIDVGGVGYLVFCGARTLARLPGAGEAARLFVETHVREDHIHLYGFYDAVERAWFRLLTTVQGVGARVALAILSALSTEELAQAVAHQDRTMLTRASGVGPKLAVRIVTELKDRALHMPVAASVPHMGGALPIVVGGEEEAAISALVNLGFPRAQAAGAVARAGRSLAGDGEAAPALESLIRAGLRELSQ
ncbi:MAG: Holliday junction branch migration protein RuvA [Alphaproteobacteria bacterium]